MTWTYTFGPLRVIVEWRGEPVNPATRQAMMDAAAEDYRAWFFGPGW